ncbi:MAG: ABC transporter permease [Thermoleophilaceae bacterium]|nr:ABC transporter permease [Thermoleophilaceae bacterium]
MRRAHLLAQLRVVAALSRRALKQAFRRPQFLAPVVVFPSLVLAVNTGGAGSAVHIPGFPRVHGFLDFELAGAMLQSTMLAGVSGGIALALDVEMGFIDRLVAAPVSRWVLVVGRLAGTAALGLLSALWFVAAGLIFGARIEGGVLGILTILVLLPLTAAAFGAIAAGLALKSGRASVVQGVFPLVFVVVFLSSAFFPRHLLLEPARSVADYNPMSLIAEALRYPVIRGASGGEFLKGLGGVAIVGAVGAWFSAFALRARLRAG